MSMFFHSLTLPAMFCQVNAFDSLSYGKQRKDGGTGTGGRSKCSSDEQSTSCGAAVSSDDETSTPSPVVPPPVPVDSEIRIPGLPFAIESHPLSSVADPLRHRSLRQFVQMPSYKNCQLIQIPIDFHLPITVVISLSTKVDK